MTSTKTDERAEVQARLDTIAGRIRARADEIADIERKQLAAATAGEDPDPALAAAKAALVDAQSIDQRAAAAVRAQLDQIDAAAKRARDLAELARLRAESTQKGREAQEQADGFPEAVEAAVEALKAAGTDLRERVKALRAATTEQERLTAAANALAQELGEPVETGPITYHQSGGQRVATARDPHRAHHARILAALPTNRTRIFHAAGRSARDAVEAVGHVATEATPVPRYAHMA